MEIIIIFLLICLNGLLSMAEMAVVSSRKTKLEAESKKGSKNAALVLKALQNPEPFLSTVQIGITAVGLFTGMYSGASITNWLRDYLVHEGMNITLASSLSIIAVLLLITYFTIVIGELLPKRIGLSYPERLSQTSIGVMSVLSKVLYPFVWLLTHSTTLAIKLFHIELDKDGHITEEEIRSIIQEGRNTGEVQPVEQDIMERVFAMGDRDIRSLMTHRNDLVWIDTHETWQHIEKKLKTKIHHVYPVSDSAIENIVGIIFLKDLFTCDRDHFSAKEIAHEPQFLPENVSVYHALEIFKKNKIHYAIITDEFGVMQGMVTMNDILESLVGNASELDTENEEYEIIAQEDGSWVVDGQYPFFDFLTAFNLSLDETDYPFYTVGGLFLEQSGHIPHMGETITWNGFLFEILSMEHVRIAQLRIRRCE